MVGAHPRKERLEELLGLAQAYRGWTLKQLAEALGRDPANLVPSSGVPKVDLVMRLAEVLDWEVQDVMADLMMPASAGPPNAGEHVGLRRVRTLGNAFPLTNGQATNGKTGADRARALRDAAREAHGQGRYEEAAELARQAYDLATSAKDRAIACFRELGAWDGLGRFTNALDACRRGLAERDAPLEWRMALRSALANAYYALGQHVEAESVASSVIEALSHREVEGPVLTSAVAMAWHIRGQALREQMDVEDAHEASSTAAAAAEALVIAAERYDALAIEYGQDYAGMAHTARGGLLEVESFRRQRSSREAIQTVIDELDAVSEVDERLGAIMLESYGWWCIFGCNMVLRHVSDGEEAQRHMAILTNKADEIAQRLGNWALRERVFTMEYLRRRHGADASIDLGEWVIDREDIQTIAGAMGRFARFREIAWRILRSARLA